jgi:hypothetical protein
MKEIFKELSVAHIYDLDNSYDSIEVERKMIMGMKT